MRGRAGGAGAAPAPGGSAGAASPAPGASDIERLLGAFCSQQGAVVEAARRLLTDERAPHRQKLLADLIHNLSENILAEDKDDDKKWFEGVFVARKVVRDSHVLLCSETSLLSVLLLLKQSLGALWAGGIGYLVRALVIPSISTAHVFRFL